MLPADPHILHRNTVTGTAVVSRRSPVFLLPKSVRPKGIKVLFSVPLFVNGQGLRGGSVLRREVFGAPDLVDICDQGGWRYYRSRENDSR